MNEKLFKSYIKLTNNFCLNFSDGSLNHTSKLDNSSVDYISKRSLRSHSQISFLNCTLVPYKDSPFSRRYGGRKNIQNCGKRKHIVKNYFCNQLATSKIEKKETRMVSKDKPNTRLKSLKSKSLKFLKGKQIDSLCSNASSENLISPASSKSAADRKKRCFKMLKNKNGKSDSLCHNDRSSSLPDHSTKKKNTREAKTSNGTDKNYRQNTKPKKKNDKRSAPDDLQEIKTAKRACHPQDNILSLKLQPSVLSRSITQDCLTGNLRKHTRSSSKLTKKKSENPVSGKSKSTRKQQTQSKSLKKKNEEKASVIKARLYHEKHKEVTSIRLRKSGSNLVLVSHNTSVMSSRTRISCSITNSSHVSHSKSHSTLRQLLPSEQSLNKKSSGRGKPSKKQINPLSSSSKRDSVDFLTSENSFNVSLVNKQRLRNNSYDLLTNDINDHLDKKSHYKKKEQDVKILTSTPLTIRSKLKRPDIQLYTSEKSCIKKTKNQNAMLTQSSTTSTENSHRQHYNISDKKNSSRLKPNQVSPFAHKKKSQNVSFHQNILSQTAHAIPIKNPISRISRSILKHGNKVNLNMQSQPPEHAILPECVVLVEKLNAKNYNIPQEQKSKSKSTSLKKPECHLEKEQCKSRTLNRNKRKNVDDLMTTPHLTKKFRNRINLASPKSLVCNNRDVLTCIETKTTKKERTNRKKSSKTLGPPPKKGTLKRARWVTNKLKERNVGYEDDIFDAHNFDVLKKFLQMDDNFELPAISTPKCKTLFTPGPSKGSPRFKDCISPGELQNARKNAEEYIYRRKNKKRNCDTDNEAEKNSIGNSAKISNVMPEKRKLDFIGALNSAAEIQEKAFKYNSDIEYDDSSCDDSL